ncbi:MAG: hypothetical protein HRU38_05865 [Saccharospirillaceae bacterium]|nr:hypothetical protein [Pseudomonadales bacterium]NRB78183.1 hypothetical protein [Saccharospirillaceae bacterium]
MNKLSDLQNLKTLILNKNKLTDSSFVEHIGSIENLSLKDNFINRLGYYPNLNLKYLELTNTNLQTVDGLENYFNLEEIRLLDNELYNIDALLNLPKLRILNAQGNNISDVSKFAIKNSSVVDLNLRVNPIDCLYTSLKEVDGVVLSCP